MCELIVKHEDVQYTKHTLIRIFNHTYDSTIDGMDFFLEHWHEELEITYNINGQSVFCIDGKRIQGDPGRLIVINPESIHSIIVDQNIPEAGIHAVTILLHPKFLEENFPQYKEYIFDNEKTQTSAEIRDIILKLSQCTLVEEAHFLQSSLYVKGLVLLLLHYMGETGMIRPKEASDRKLLKGSMYLKEILLYVEENYRESISQKEVANQFHFTQQYFSRYFKKYMGKTFTEYLMWYRVQRARNDLLESNKRMVDIAMENGFSEERRFVAAFKKFYGETPLQYQRNRKL